MLNIPRYFLDCAHKNRNMVLLSRYIGVFINLVFSICLLFADLYAIQSFLIKQYEGATRFVQVMPLEDDEGLSVAEIYGSVLLKQNLAAGKKNQRQQESSDHKNLSNVKDIFFIKDKFGEKFAKRVFLTGEAGHGKTVFSLKLIDCWTEAKKHFRNKNCESSIQTKQVDKKIATTKGTGSPESTNVRTMVGIGKQNAGSLPPYHHMKDNLQGDNDMQTCLSLFDLVFYVPLRHAKHGVSSIVDLVCDSLSECEENDKQKIKQMLCDGKIRCLVILDGLDEWRAPGTCKLQGFPDSDDLVNCVVFCTMRPWRMATLQVGLDSTCDKEVQILGLESVETVISNILVNFYGLQFTSELFKQKYTQFLANAKLENLKSLMKIPLMLIASCLVWNEDSELDIAKGSSYFMTFFYLKLTGILVTRAEDKYEIMKSFLCEKRQKPSTSITIPDMLSEFDQIIDFLEILILVGRLALQDLVSDEPHLVFPRNKIEREIGPSNVDLALKAGILSQTKAPGLSYQKRISLSFFHKSIQEFISALCLACGDTGAFALFCKHCCTVDKLMELSNMLIFVCGLDPVVGHQLFKHLVDVVNNDADIIRYRGPFTRQGLGKVEALFKIQLRWFNEMKENMIHTNNTKPIPVFHVTDVYLDEHSSSDDVCLAREFVGKENNSIVSVHLYRVNHPVHSIIQHLPSCKQLSSLYIRGINGMQDIELLARVMPELVSLQHVAFGYSASLSNVVRAAVQRPSLKSVELHHITLTENVTLASTLETLVLIKVQPAHFILPSVYQCNQLRNIRLDSMNLTDAVTLTHMPMLETVRLRRLESAHFILPSLCQCSHLKCLQLEHIALTDNVPLPSSLETVRLCWIKSAHYIIQSLQKCIQIKILHIADLNGENCKLQLAHVLPHMVHLQHIDYTGNLQADCSYIMDTGDVAIAKALQSLASLKHMRLEHMNLGDDGTLLAISDMSHLAEVRLVDVHMSACAWKVFVSSFLSANHTVCVKLENTNIDIDSVNTVHNNPRFTVLQHRDN